MFSIDEFTQQISLNRGDTGQFSIFINEGDELEPLQYSLREKDNLYLAIEEPNQPFEKALVKKVINTSNSLLDSDGNIIVNINPEDTECLMPGLYYYEIKAKLYRGNIFRNRYVTITLKFDDTYIIYDEENNEKLDEGFYTSSGNTFVLRSQTGEEREANFDPNNKILVLDTIAYRQEQDSINTIIPQREFIIER